MAAELLEGPSWFSHNLTVETPINIDTLIYMLAPEDLPLLFGVNSDGMGILPSAPVNNVEFKWLEEDVPLPRGTLNEVLDTSETDVTMTTGEAVKFAVGDAIRINGEIMLVTDIDTTTDVLTVTRGSSTVSGTTVGSHAIGDEVVGLGTVLIEGAVGNANYKGRDLFSNYCQIWTKKFNVSATAQIIPKYGVSSELARQMMNGMHHIAVGMEQAALYGVKFRHATNFRRQTGGLEYYIEDVDSTTTWLTVDGIEAKQQDAWDRGGHFDVIMAKPSAFSALNNTIGREGIQTVDVTDNVRGRQRAEYIQTSYGRVALVRNRWVRENEAFGFSRENFIYRKMRPLQTEKLAKNDDTDTWMIVAEGGFEVKGQDHMAMWTGLDQGVEFPADLI